MAQPATMLGHETPRQASTTPSGVTDDEARLADLLDASLAINNDQTTTREGGAAPSQTSLDKAVPAIHPWSPSDEIVTTWPLSPAQSSLLTPNQQQPSSSGSHCHHQLRHHAFAIPVDTDIALLESTWQTIQRRHAILRTSYHHHHYMHPGNEDEDETQLKGGSWTAAVHAEARADWNVVDLRFVPPPPEEQAKGLAAQEGKAEDATTPAKKAAPPPKKPNRKVKAKKKTGKYVDKRQPRDDDDFMSDPSLYESFDRKILTGDGDEGGRLNLDSGTFWDVPSSEDEVRDELGRIASSIEAVEGDPPVKVHVVVGEDQVVLMASMARVVDADPAALRALEELWRLYNGRSATPRASTPLWLDRIRDFVVPGVADVGGGSSGAGGANGEENGAQDEDEDDDGFGF